MGTYLNPGKTRYQMAVNSEIFIDKSEMISYLNSVVNTSQRYVSVSRPRRFGKTMAADMITAYYDREADSKELFEKCRISLNAGGEDGSQWDMYLGKFNVIRLVMTDFFNSKRTVDEAINTIECRILDELAEEYPEIQYDENDFYYSIDRFYRKTKIQLVIVIDEWDAVFREHKDDREGQKKYLDFLRDWLKDKEYIALAYITGILPIKKYGKHSALNMFDEYSMTQPMRLASYTGFTVDEVKNLCDQYEMDYTEISGWYDGYIVSDYIPVNKRKLYRLGEYEEHRIRIYSPLSVVNAMRSGEIENYWNETENYEALQQYVDWDFDGLKEDVAILMSGGRVPVDVTRYQNDMTSFYSKDDILTMFIHLGYLGYQRETKEVFIPNKEVLDVFKSSTRNREWTVTFRALNNSRRLLEATWNCEKDTVAELLEAAHDKAGNRTYHSEAGLSYAVQLAYYAAQDLYTIIPELDTGKGYADLAFIPNKPDIPAMLIELKYEQDADTAISQIHRQKYPDRLELYKGNIILVGINYDRTVTNDSEEFKHHSCEIEKG
ncbi:MAG: AAA family ATPase [Lachnospiraceae bacterium]|nr:AAA family ATPase [Lachnospiraceae bacterium]